MAGVAPHFMLCIKPKTFVYRMFNTMFNAFYINNSIVMKTTTIIITNSV